MAGNPIAELVANLRFSYQKGSLNQFRKDLESTAKRIDSKQGIVGSFNKADKSQQQYFKNLTRGFQQTKPNIIQARRQLARIRQAFKDNQISHQQYVEGRRRGLMTINKLEQEQHIKRMRRARELARAQGPFAGGRDPRQKGTHNLISAIHSDVGLGAIAGGFALAQSTRAFQELKAMEQGLTAATGSFERAGKEMEFLIDLSRRLGVFVGDMGNSFAQFSASAAHTSLRGQEVRDIFEGVASQARVLNLSAADTQGVFRALNQVMSKGTVMSEDFKNQMAERMAGAMQAGARAAKELGITTEATVPAFRKAMEEGKLISEEFLPEFSRQLMEASQRGGALQRAMNNTGAAIGRFRTNLFLANAQFQEAGMDKGIRDLVNSASTFIQRADELWKLMGKVGPALFTPFRALFELLGSLSDRMGVLGDAAEGNEQKLKALGLIVGSLFRWSRKLLAVFLLIPAAMSGVSKLIDGEMLTWQEWALTLAGIAASLPIILRAMRGIKNLGGVAGQLKGTGGTAGNVAEEAKRTAQRAAPRIGSEWQSGRGAIWNRAAEAARSAAQKGARGGPGFLPIGAGSVLPEDEFVRRQNDVPWWDLIGKIEQRQQEMNQQAIISGDVTFNINGDNSTEIADEVLKTIQNMHREASINEPSQEK